MEEKNRSLAFNFVDGTISRVDFEMEIISAFALVSQLLKSFL